MSAKSRLPAASSASSPRPSALSPPRTGTTVLAFDFGTKRIGVAVGDLTLAIAHPLTTIRAEDSAPRFAAIAALIDEWHPCELVVGVPAHDDGREHQTGALARRFARRLEGRFHIATRLVDERLTSHVAEGRLREAGTSRRRIRQSLDAAAAQEILQSYFATRSSSISNSGP